MAEEENPVEDPLITPCKCDGSLKYIHHSCLKQWFKGKRIVKQYNEVVTTFFWYDLQCELCKTQYPYAIKTPDGTYVNIIEYEKPARTRTSCYLVLESISSSPNKVIHVVDFTRASQVYIGRGQEADIRATDNSVSRLHALITRSAKGKFYLKDYDSKFGTVV